MTLLTGDEYFPSGMGTFDIIQNDFLVFEEGPTESFTLQWATYQDASDQTSLSRIWGGIHPPIDDIRGRIIGEKIGIDAFNLALQYFNGTLGLSQVATNNYEVKIYPVPFNDELHINHNYNGNLTVDIFGLDGKQVSTTTLNSNTNVLTMQSLASGMYFVKFSNVNKEVLLVKKVVKN
jgi:hypothetical protein